MQSGVQSWRASQTRRRLNRLLLGAGCVDENADRFKLLATTPSNSVEQRPTLALRNRDKLLLDENPNVHAISLTESEGDTANSCLADRTS